MTTTQSLTDASAGAKKPKKEHRKGDSRRRSKSGKPYDPRSRRDGAPDPSEGPPEK